MIILNHPLYIVEHIKELLGQQLKITFFGLSIDLKIENGQVFIGTIENTVTGVMNGNAKLVQFHAH